MKLVKFDPAHVTMFQPHAEQLESVGQVTLERARVLAMSGPCFTGLDDDGNIVGCGGIAEVWEGRHMAWALLSVLSGRHMISITKTVRRLLLLVDGRIEVVVRHGFDAGDRWAKALGFKFHHHEEKFLPGGFDANIYARFQ